LFFAVGPAVVASIAVREAAEHGNVTGFDPEGMIAVTFKANIVPGLNTYRIASGAPALPG